ncbi:MAG TPA: hypothetical protein DHW82_12970 [Spirochaetia bacterium]|nr:MAG: hypothetical protein A2Y41_00320 [Spirochaetes bacterium GWB1_36_13]HCL57902.1 hypothetical protein [Spirochaetia bacterium]
MKKFLFFLWMTLFSSQIIFGAEYKTSASSVLDNAKRYSHENIIDGNISTCWSEGGKGIGKGEWVQIDFGIEKDLYYLGIIPGYSKYNDKVGEVWFKNPRLKKAKLEFSDHSILEVEFVDKQQMQFFEINKKTRFVKLIIEDVYPTLKWEDTSISEILPVFENIKEMQAELNFNYQMISDKTNEFYALLKIQAPYEENQDRDPVNISLVIDRSGSMQDGDKMKFAREAAKLIVGALGGKDILSIVGYDDKIDTILNPIEVSNNNKNEIIKKIDELYPRNSTNIMGGIIRAVELIKQKQGSGKKISKFILLLSDGLANEGITNPDEMKKIVLENKEQDDISVSTFGLGTDYSEDVLLSLAEASLGKYYFIKNPREIFMYFHKELTNILKSVASDIKVVVEEEENCKISSVYGYQMKNKQFEMPVISQGQQKLVLFQVKKTGNGSMSIKGKIKFYNPISKQNEELSYSAFIQPEKGNQDILNTMIQPEVLRILSANNLVVTIKDYSEGKEKKAIERLEQHIKKLVNENKYLKSSVLAQEIEILKSILEDMKKSGGDSGVLIKQTKKHANDVLKSE